jgi:hypothetical protein
MGRTRRGFTPPGVSHVAPEVSRDAQRVRTFAEATSDIDGGRHYPTIQNWPVYGS